MKNKLIRNVFILLSLLIVGQTVVAQNRIGLLQDVKQDDGYIVIDEKRIEYSGNVTITYNAKPVSTTVLIPGLRVSYTLNSDGSIKTLKVLGPLRLMNKIDEN